jgi:hypothetical protein
MPTNRTRRKRDQLPDVEDWQIGVLLDWDLTEFEVSPAELWFFTSGVEERMSQIWTAFSHDLVEEFTNTRPGRRPRIWWAQTAPKMATSELERHGWMHTFFAAALPSPRRQLGGSGAVLWHRYPSYVPVYERGLPALWDRIDAVDPPAFESEAEYLRRHKLFLPGEERRLVASDFEPEHILESPFSIRRATRWHRREVIRPL